MRVFLPDPSALVRVCRFLQAALSDLAVTDGGQALIDVLPVTVNELATNAMVHARTAFAVRVLVNASVV